MSTPANPQHLLRRPKKPQPKHFDLRIVAVGAVIAVVAGGAIAGFVAFGHGKSAAAPPAPAATGRSASLALVQSSTPAFVAPSAAKHKAHKPASPAASPSPNATDTPQPTPTPAPEASVEPLHVTPADSSAHAKHEAALKLAAARRAAALASASSLVPSQSTAAATQPTTIPAPVPAATIAPAPSIATPDAEPTPVYAPTIVVDARFVDRVTPIYPDIAREQGAQGTAIVLATIGPDGRVLSVSVDQSTGDRQLDNAAIAAARSSRFVPPEIDGKPATETYRIVYTFDPNG